MKKPITTKVHGALDYSTAVLLLALPKLLKSDTKVSSLLRSAAILTVLYSAVTRYEWGLWRVVPMRAHLLMDGASGLSFCLSPFILTREPSVIRFVLGGIGLFELTVTLLTQAQPEKEDL